MTDMEMQDVIVYLCIPVATSVMDNSQSTLRLKICVAKEFARPQTDGHRLLDSMQESQRRSTLTYTRVVE
jgi:hypothetical protein